MFHLAIVKYFDGGNCSVLMYYVIPSNKDNTLNLNKYLTCTEMKGKRLKTEKHKFHILMWTETNDS